MPRDAFVLKIQRVLWHPKCARKVSGLSRKQAPDPFQSTHARQIPPFQVCKSAYEVKIIAAYLKGLLKYRRTAFFFLEYLFSF